MLLVSTSWITVTLACGLQLLVATFKSFVEFDRNGERVMMIIKLGGIARIVVLMRQHVTHQT